MAKTKNEIEDKNQDSGNQLILAVPSVQAILPPEQEEKIAQEMALYSKKYKGFEIKSKKDYEDLKVDLKAVRDKRILVDGKDGWRVQVKRLADTVSATLLSYFEPVEAQLAAIKKTYDDAEAERIRLEKEAREKLIRDRTAAIYAVGGVFNGSAYVVGDAEIYPDDLGSDGFDAKLEAMKAERVRIDEAERVRRAEAERLRLEEVERQRLAKEKADADARRIAELEAKLKAQETETARLAAEETAKQGRLDAIERARELPKVIASDAVAPNQVAGIDGDGKPFVVETSTPIADPVALPVTKSETITTPSIIPTDAHDRENFLAGAKAAFGMAKREFPAITPAQWRDCWKRFQEL